MKKNCELDGKRLVNIVTSADHVQAAAGIRVANKAISRAISKAISRAADNNRANKAGKLLAKRVRPHRVAKAMPSVLVPVLVQHAVIKAAEAKVVATKAAEAKVPAIKVASPIVVAVAVIPANNDVVAVAMIRVVAAIAVDAIEVRAVTSRFRIRLVCPRTSRRRNRLQRRWPKVKSR